MRYLSGALQVLSRHRQGGDKHGDTAQHEHGPHQAAHASQKDGPEAIQGNVSN